MNKNKPRNDVLYDLSYSPKKKSSRKEWMGHVARMGS